MESLKQFIEKQSVEMNEMRSAAEDNDTEITSLKKTINAVESLCEDHKSSVRQLSIELAQAKATADDKERVNAALARELQESRQCAISLQHEIESFETRMASKDDLVTDLRIETTQLRQVQEEMEKKLLETEEVVSENMRVAGEVDIRVKQSESIKENYSRLLADHDDIKQKFEVLLKRNTEMTHKNAECMQALTDSVKQVKIMEEQVDLTLRERDRIKEEIETLEQSHNELLRR